MPSPIPKPAKLKLIEGRGNGTDSGGRKVAEGPEFSRSAPEAPGWLPSEARAEWDRVVPELDRLGILKSIDRASLTSYCMTWARLVEASAIVEREGTVVREGVGRRISAEGEAPVYEREKLYRHPALLTAEAASKELRAWANEFGLTPSAERRLASTKDGKDGAEGNPFAAAAG